MDKVKVAYPQFDKLINSKTTSKPELYVLKSIAASFVGALIPAAIFYFLM